MVYWNGLLDTFTDSAGEYKVVETAVAFAPWSSWIRARHKQTAGYPEIGILPSQDLVVDLPSQGHTLAILEGSKWEIWVAPNNELQIVVPHSNSSSGKRTPPEEYFLAGR